jgi:rhodanese-related sulfurtransferase
MNLNKSWKSVFVITAVIYLISFVLGVMIHAFMPNTETPAKLIVPEGYIQQISAMKTISIEDAYNSYTNNNAVFIDARDNAEYREGHIKDAINIPYDKFQQDYPLYEKLLTKNKKIITYCHGTGCGLSVDVAKDLMAIGYTNVYVMTEGWPGWINARLPISVGKEP